MEMTVFTRGHRDESRMDDWKSKAKAVKASLQAVEAEHAIYARTQAKLLRSLDVQLKEAQQQLIDMRAQLASAESATAARLAARQRPTPAAATPHAGALFRGPADAPVITPTGKALIHVSRWQVAVVWLE